MKLNSRVAIVTGAARGIGKACAEALAAAGAAVMIADVDGQGASGAARELEEKGYKAQAYAVDITQKNEVEALVSNTVSIFGRLDILVNNAGVLGRQPLGELTEEEWERLFDINCKGTFLMTQAAVPHMLTIGKGKIVNFSSVAAIIPRPYQPHYCGSKAAIIQMSKVWALELAPLNINVNVVCPGMTETEMVATTLADPAARQRWRATIPKGRFALPEDHAQAVLYLCSDASDHITGQVIVVDGGQTLMYAHGFGQDIVRVPVRG